MPYGRWIKVAPPNNWTSAKYDINYQPERPGGRRDFSQHIQLSYPSGAKLWGTCPLEGLKVRIPRGAQVEGNHAPRKVLFQRTNYSSARLFRRAEDYIAMWNHVDEARAHIP